MLDVNEIQFLLTCVDTHVRQHGLPAAQNSLMVASKLQAMAAPSTEEPTDEDGPSSDE